MTRPPRAVAVGAVCATRIFRVDAIPPPPAKVLHQSLRPNKSQISM